MKQPELGKKIAILRTKKGLTQEELVNKCNINVRTIQRIETGEVTPRNSTIKIIFEALDYSPTAERNKRNENYFNNFSKHIDINTIYEQHIKIHYQKIKTMDKQPSFFKNFFLAAGVIWFLCSLSILLFGLNFQRREIIIMLVIPLTYAILRKFEEKKNNSQAIPQKSKKKSIPKDD